MKALFFSSFRFGAYDGVGYALSGAKVNMFSYRAEALELLSGSTSVGILSGTTAVRFNASVAAFAASTGSPVTSKSLLDVRVSTIGENLYENALLDTANTAAAAASHADQPGAPKKNHLLLRSKLMVVEVSNQDSASPLVVNPLSSEAFYVTLDSSTHPFNTSFRDFERFFDCVIDGQVTGHDDYAFLERIERNTRVEIN